MPEKSASIAQQRIMGMAWAVRKGKLDPKKIKDADFRKKIEKIANSDKFSSDTLHKMAKTKHRDPETKKKIPYLIGKGTPEDPERKRAPYKKKAVAECLSYDEFMVIKESFEEFYTGYCEALQLMESTETVDREEIYESYMSNVVPNNPGMNVSYSGTQPVKHWKNVDKNYNGSLDQDEDEAEDLMDAQFQKAREMFKGYVFAPTFEEFQEMDENMKLNPGMNVTGMGPVSSPGNPGTTTDFHNQEPGSGDVPWPFKEGDDEEEEEKKRIKKELKSKNK